MKKIALSVLIGCASTAAFAGPGSVGIGYQASTVAPNYGDCWSECFGDGEPAGFAINAKYEIAAGVFVSADYADLKDKEDHYDDKIEISQTRLAASVGYRYALNETTNLTAAIQFSDLEWEYDWKDGNGTIWTYNAEDDGVSFVIGVDTAINEKLTLGSNFSLGFETGISGFLKSKLTDNVDLQMSYTRSSYELGTFSYNCNGSSCNPSNGNGDGDYQFNDEHFRVSINYNF
jgi:hypothetical protein